MLAEHESIREDPLTVKTDRGCEKNVPWRGLVDLRQEWLLHSWPNRNYPEKKKTKSLLVRNNSLNEVFTAELHRFLRNRRKSV